MGPVNSVAAGLDDETSFLVAITSARRVSEIVALGAKEPHTSFRTGRFILRPKPEVRR